MITNSGSDSTSDDLNLKINPNYKQKAEELQNKPEVSDKELIEFTKKIRNAPLFEFDAIENLVTENSFEILKKNNKLNPIFVLNLINLINIINFVWNCTKKKVEKFHKILLDLNIMFSYIKNKDQIEYALLSLIPLPFYEFIAKYGIKCFKKEYKFDMDYLSSDRNISQVGLVYQENTFVQINSYLNNKQIDTPTIMYYIEHEDSKALFQKKIFNQPENFLALDYVPYDVFYGYNEIDYSFILEEDMEIEQNFIFNKVAENGEVKRVYNPNEPIIFFKNINIFIEMTTKIEDKKNISNTIKNGKRFYEAFDQPAYNGIIKKYHREGYENFLLYNNQRKDAYDIFEKSEDKEANKNIKIYFNSGYVQLASIVSLKNEIRSLNERMTNEKEKLNSKLESLKNDIHDQIQDLSNKMVHLEKDNKLLNFLVSNHVELNSIQNFFEKFVKSSTITVLSTFSAMNSKYLKFYYEYIGDDNPIMNIANKVIGKFLESKDEIKEFFSLLNLIDLKISNNMHTKSYYESYKKILVGPNWNASLTAAHMQSCNLFFKNENVDIIKDILRCIILLEVRDKLENNFFEAVLYYVSAISRNDISCYNSFYLYHDKKDMRKNVNYFILSLNNKFLDSLIPK